MASNIRFSAGLDGQNKIRVSVVLVDQDGRGARGEPLLNTDRLCHSNRHIARASISCKTDWLERAGTIVPIDDNAVANHGSTKKLDSSELLRRGKLRHLQGFRQTRHHTTSRGVGCLFYPPAE